MDEDRLIIYGSRDADTISVDSARYPAWFSLTLPGTFGLSVVAGAGNDTIIGMALKDVIYAGSGNDVIQGGNGDNELFGRAGNDVIYGGDDNDIIHGGENDDSIFGGQGADTIHGGEGTDVIDAGSGGEDSENGDIIYAGYGDTVVNVDEYDTIYFNDVLLTGSARWAPDNDARYPGRSGTYDLDFMTGEKSMFSYQYDSVARTLVISDANGTMTITGYDLDFSTGDARIGLMEWMVLM